LGKRIKNVIIAYIYAALGASAILAGCGADEDPVDKEKIISSCNVNADQAATFAGRWASLPVYMAFHTNDFSEAQKNGIVKAAMTWNSFFQGTRGSPIFDYSQSADLVRVTNEVKPTGDLCISPPFFQDGRFSKPISIYGLTASWPYQPEIIALTTYCDVAVSGDRLPRKTHTIMEINIKDYFSTTGASQDIESIVLHELGHVVGLLHSCETEGKTGMPGCESAPAVYQQAVMYPAYDQSAGANGEKRQSLNPNDQGRLNCLY
jgi:hypothetical protein